jgi:hypothetical protein
VIVTQLKKVGAFLSTTLTIFSQPSSAYVRIGTLDTEGLQSFENLGPRQSRAISRFVQRWSGLTATGTQTRNANYAQFASTHHWVEDSPPATIKIEVCYSCLLLLLVCFIFLFRWFL